MISDKKLQKIQKTLGKDTMKEMDSMIDVELRLQIIQAQETIKTASEGLEANTKYQSIKADLAHFNKGLAAVKKRQNAITRYSQHLLEGKNK
jgi:hypothetical protein